MCKYLSGYVARIKCPLASRRVTIDTEIRTFLFIRLHCFSGNFHRFHPHRVPCTMEPVSFHLQTRQLLLHSSHLTRTHTPHHYNDVNILYPCVMQLKRKYVNHFETKCVRVPRSDCQSVQSSVVLPSDVHTLIRLGRILWGKIVCKRLSFSHHRSVPTFVKSVT